MTRTIDTRFFIRHFTADTEDLKIRAGRRMRELREESAIIPTIVIHELYKHQCESLGKETAETRTTLIIKSGFRIVTLDLEVAKRAAELRCKHPKLPTADAIIAATAITTRSIRVVTDDPHFQTLREIRTEWL